MKQKGSQRLKAFFAPGSLRIQLLSRSLLILAALLVLIGFLQYVFMKEVVYRNKATSLQSQIMSIPHGAWERFGESFGDHQEEKHADKLEDNKGNNEMKRPFFFIPDASIAFIDLNGNYSILSTGHDEVNPPKLNTQEYLEALKNKPGLNYEVIETGGTEQLVVLQPIGPPGHQFGVAQISTLTSPLKELLIRQLLTFLFLSLIALLIGLFGFLPVLKKTLIPLFNMVETAEQIDAGNLAQRFPTGQGQTEIDRLSESFNGMLDRLEASFEAEKETKEQMRRFIADASHELRTPLTSIHGFLEVLLRGAMNQPDQLHKALQSMHSESERLNKLVHDLLLLAKLDRTPHVELTEGQLDILLRNMEPQLRILAGKRRLSLRIEPNINCKFDPDKIKQVILNLFQNAVQHTDPDKGYIQIALNRENKGVQLTLQDNGSGISADHLPHVFERFYRSDSSRTRKYGGAGLGLAITKSIIEAHGGIIRVESQDEGGSTFQVWLPE